MRYDCYHTILLLLFVGLSTRAFCVCYGSDVLNYDTSMLPSDTSVYSTGTSDTLKLTLFIEDSKIHPNYSCFVVELHSWYTFVIVVIYHQLALVPNGINVVVS